MRVAINGWFWDEPTCGSGQYTRQLVQALDSLDAKLKVRLVVPSKAETGLESGERALSETCSFYPVVCSRTKIGKLIFEQLLFPRTCAKLGADVAHVPYWAPPLRSPVPLVVTVHDLIPLMLRHYRGGIPQRLYTALVRSSTPGARCVLTDSEASRQDILSHLGLPPETVSVVPLAVDDRYGAQPSPHDPTVRAAYGLPANYVLYLGGFDVRKNLATVVSTYRWVGSAVAGDYPLVIAGQLPERDTRFTPDPRRLLREADVEERFVHFTGIVDETDKPAIYRGAVAFLFPSIYEGFGLPPLEALACGTPVVGSDAASLPEVVGDAGVLRPARDAEGMAKALVRLATDERFRTEMKRRAALQAARFSWARTAQRTFRAYQKALG